MNKPSQGDVFEWPVIPDNHPMGVKRRMWVVVTRNAFNHHPDNRHVLACPLTSYPPTEIDVEVKATPHNPLRHTSSLLASMITPILKVELGEPIGRLPLSALRPVLDRVRMLIEIP